MAVGIYGGAFDPIHNGHLITVQSVFEKRNLKKIIFVPAYISPLKTDQKHAESKHRLKMVELAIEDKPEFISTDIELKRKDVSYTIDTLKEFKKSYDDIELIIGYDNLVVFHKWYKPDKILELCKLVVLRREVDEEPKEKNKYYNKAELLDTPTINISSTDIRLRLANDLPIDDLVPLKVKEYIYKNGLYK